MHVAGNKHFLALCPKYLLSANAVFLRVDTGLVSEVKFHLTLGGATLMTSDQRPVSTFKITVSGRRSYFSHGVKTPIFVNMRGDILLLTFTELQ